MARGDPLNAERAYQKALKRAQRFPAKDHRRGLMLSWLSQFVVDQGRYHEAKILLEECVEILACHQDTNPMDYFNALNLHAVYFIELRDFDSAQRILEKVLDLTVLTSKANEDWAGFERDQNNEIKFAMCLNLVSVFIEIRELTEAGYRLKEADSIFPDLKKKIQARWHDFYILIRTSLMCEMGNLTDAMKEIARAKDPEDPRFLRASAKILLAKQDFDQAEQSLRKYFEHQSKTGMVHRREVLAPTLDLAEALFGQAKHDDAFASLQEARSIVADFALPSDAAWRKTLETWLQRAREQGRVDVAASLDAELRAMPAMANQAITILAKFRLHPQTVS
jgi:tetratricopeptide (TPR) repeat protein